VAAEGLVAEVGGLQVSMGLPGEEADVVAHAMAIFSEEHFTHAV
jgi:hypothetical protein